MEKKEGKNKGFFKFFETLILIALVGAAVMIVLDVFFDQINGEYDTYEDYEYYDYSYDYNDDYYSDLDYDNKENTSTFNFVSIEDFMNSDLGKEFLEKSNYNTVTSNEIETQNVISNEVENTTANVILDAEEIYNYYDAQKEMKEKFETQKKKIEIKDEGKSTNNEIMVSIKNNDEDFLYDVTLNTIFFKDDKIVLIDVQDINIIDGNNTKYIKVSQIPEEYDNYEFLISKRYYMEYYNELLNDDISFTSNDTIDTVQISVQNKSNKRANRLHFTVLYFNRAGNLIDFETIQEYNIKANKKCSLTTSGIWDEDQNEYIKFDDYKVILDYAENYGY